MSDRKTVLITGGGSGIGKDICKLFYNRGDNIIVASLVEDELVQLKRELPGSETQAVETIQIDLALDNAANTLFLEIKNRSLVIDILINNAGFGAYGAHVDLDYSRIKNMINLNCQTPALLCHLFGNEMKAKGCGRILNVGSTIAFQPLPNLANYSASKAFVVTFTEAFAEEMAPYGVVVCCLCPGTTATKFLDAAGIFPDDETASIGNIANKIAMRSENVAKIGFDGLLRGKRKIVPGALNIIHRRAVHWIPNRVITWCAQKVIARRKKSF